MRHFAAAFLLTLLWLAPAHAQNTQCRTAPVGTSSSNCASEAFVTQSVAAAPLAAATKSQQQAGTSNTVAVTPLHQQDHDSAAKAWGFYAVNAPPANATLLRGFGVGTLAHASAGVYVLTFSTSFASANDFGCNFTPQGIGAPIAYQVTSTASTVSFNTLNISGVGADGSAIFLACFGRQ